MKILGIDYGEKKIGLAIGDFKTGLVEPEVTLKIGSCQLQIMNLIKENDLQKIVIGLPGSRLDEKIKDFGLKLSRQVGLPVDYYDETLTTNEAGKILGLVGRSRNYKKRMEDAIAAAIMLKSYLEKEEGYV